MNTKFNLIQIEENEWEKGDFRPIAEIHKTTIELFEKYKVTFSEYFEEGLGCKCKIAFFQTPSDKRFFVIEYFNSPFPLTNIFISHSSETAMHDLNEIKLLLGLSDADLYLVYKF